MHAGGGASRTREPAAAEVAARTFLTCAMYCDTALSRLPASSYWHAALKCSLTFWKYTATCACVSAGAPPPSAAAYVSIAECVCATCHADA